MTEATTVLIVEDEESLATLHNHHLQNEYETEVAFNAGEALVKLSPDIDLVFLDRRMPGMSGDELLEHIEDWESECQVIMVTAVDPELALVDLPIAGYLTKPVSKQEMLDAAEQALLISKYESLVFEYYEAKRKYALLLSEYSTGEIESDEDFLALENEVERLENEISSTLDSFPDEEFKTEFMDLHRPDSVSTDA
jgi:DNA-binding NtrC family response regulator